MCVKFVSAPNHPFTVNVFTLSSASVFIQWSKPTEPNGILLGYKIYTKEINESVPYAKMKEVVHLVNDSDKLQAKLTGLDEGMTYRIGISAVNCAGESNVYNYSLLGNQRVLCVFSEQKLKLPWNHTRLRHLSFHDLSTKLIIQPRIETKFATSRQRLQFPWKKKKTKMKKSSIIMII